jgi:DNA-binding response OmpR family regulator
MRVLIVDDNADIAEAAAELLSLLGHDCRTATSAANGLAVAEVFKPALAIIDLGLPDLSGYDLLGQLRARLGPGAPFAAALTGWSEARSKALAAGFDHFLVKPARRDQLCEVIELARQRQRGA